MVICLERGADLHTAQLMPLPLTVSCFCKIQFSFTFLVPAHPGSHGQRAIKWVCLTVSHLFFHAQMYAAHIKTSSKETTAIKSLPLSGRCGKTFCRQQQYEYCHHLLRQAAEVMRVYLLKCEYHCQ